MDKKTFQRMIVERRHLYNRIDKLRVFFATETFAKLSDMEKSWLREQYRTMTDYYLILSVRINYYEKEVRENGRSFKEDPAE